TRTSRPEPRSAQAHEEPAGPPPTITTSQFSTVVILSFFRLDRDEPWSTGSHRTLPLRTRSGRAAWFRYEKQRLNPPDRDATSALTTNRTGSQSNQNSPGIARAILRVFGHSETGDSQHRSLRISLVRGEAEPRSMLAHNRRGKYA